MHACGHAHCSPLSGCLPVEKQEFDTIPSCHICQVQTLCISIVVRLLRHVCCQKGSNAGRQGPHASSGVVCLQGELMHIHQTMDKIKQRSSQRSQQHQSGNVNDTVSMRAKLNERYVCTRSQVFCNACNEGLTV